MDFINREKEIGYLHNHLKKEPNSILFVYGPKSSGKSRLLKKVATNLDTERYAVDFLDLRGVVIYDFKTFLDVFFPKNIRGKFIDILSGVTFNTGFFSIKMDEESALSENAFGIMISKLESAKKRGINPVIIIDEIQVLKNIYINGERHLIDQLFNLFITITKTNHLAHVILATSDSYFIEEIYNSAKLSKTSEFFLLDHFDKETVVGWLAKKKMNDADIETIWRYTGGCPWEINRIIDSAGKEKTIEEFCKEIVNANYYKVSDYIFLFENEKEKIFYQVVSEIVKNSNCKKEVVKNKKILVELLREMIEHDFWFYNSEQGGITANSKSIELAFKTMIEQKDR